MVSKSYSKGISWIDDCRIGFEDRQNQQKIFANGNGGVYKQSNTSKDEYVSVKGRFPANLLVSDDMLNDGKIDKKGKTKISQVGKGRGVIGNHDGRKTLTQPKEGLMMARTLGDGGSNSRFYSLDKWFDNLIDV